MTIKIVPNTKIRIKSPEHSKYVQEIAFKSGFRWGTNNQKPRHLSAPFLYFERSRRIKFGEKEKYLNNSTNQEIFIDLPASEGQTFSCARVGDWVFHLQAGWGTVVEVDFDDPDLQIGVIFDGQEVVEWYRVDGRVEVSDKLPSLYWGEVEIIPPPKPVRMKLVHGVEIPDIGLDLSKCERSTYFYVPCILSHKYYEVLAHRVHHNNCIRHSQTGIAYPFTEEGKQAAILHAKIMLGIVT